MTRSQSLNQLEKSTFQETASTVITIFTVFVKVTALRREYDFGKREIEKTVDQILEIFNI